MQTRWRRVVQFGFRLLYNEMAWTYNLVSWGVSLGAWRAWGRVALPFVVGKQVLEIGHGPGYMLQALETADFVPIGLDLSPYMGRLAQKRTNASLVQGQVQRLPFAAGTFDTLLSTFPTEYILETATIAEVWRVLRENGRLVIVPEGHLTGKSPLHRFILWLFAITGQNTNTPPRDETGCLEETVWQPFKAPFVTAGFAVQIYTIPLPGSCVTVIVAQKG